MKIQEYQKLAVRTMANLGSLKANGVHMALGVMSEMGELMKAGSMRDKVNIIEEHGDLNWFLAGNCELYGFSFEELYNTASISHTEEDLLNIFEIANLHKAEFAYNREMGLEKLKASMISTISWLKGICEEEEFDYLESLKKNIEKLRKRYPDKFTEEKANNRDLEVERKTLES